LGRQPGEAPGAPEDLRLSFVARVWQMSRSDEKWRNVQGQAKLWRNLKGTRQNLGKDVSELFF
jgi:hypothetical protein